MPVMTTSGVIAFMYAARFATAVLCALTLGAAPAKTDPTDHAVQRIVASAAFKTLAAPLDTVFPEGTPVKVRREGTKLYAPGVGDDTRSLAVVLAYVRALDAAKIKTKSDILFVGDVGEEGPGDLRGMRYLFGKGKYKDRVKAFF